MILYLIIAVGLTLFYSGLMVYYTLGWKRLPHFEIPTNFKASLYVSVIIPARNEGETIACLLNDLLAQNYPKHLLDIVVVDDASTDNTAEIVSQYAENGVRLLQLEKNDEHKAHKKRALEFAIKQCNSTLIITTDADCTITPNWVSTIAAFQQKHQACFISAPVAMEPSYSLFQKFQALEFAGLVGIGGAALQHRYPNMCNGANVAYLKDAFLAVNGYEGNDSIPSGDDEFLMHKMFSAFPSKVFFLKNTDAIVSTQAAQSLNLFVNQRMRWVSKSTKYENKSITLILALCYLFNLSVLINFFGAFFNHTIAYVFLGQILLKIITEGVLLFQVTRFMSLKNLIIWLVPEQLLHVVYVVVIGLLGNLGSYQWKGRKV